MTINRRSFLQGFVGMAASMPLGYGAQLRDGGAPPPKRPEDAKPPDGEVDTDMMMGLQRMPASQSLYQNVRVVDAGGRGNYTKLSTALAAITDAAADKRYRILVYGAVAETDTVVAKSYIDVIGQGAASVTITKNGAGVGFNFNDIVEAEWRDLKLVRAGALADTSNVDVLQIGQTTDRTCRFVNCDIRNEVTVGSGTVTHCTGINIGQTAAPSFVACRIKGGSVQTYGYGVLTNETTAPTFTSCDIEGGDSASGHGVVSTYASRPSFLGCDIRGGAGVTGAYGAVSYRASRPHYVACRIAAGAGGTACKGVYVYPNGSPLFEGCDIISGDGSTGSPGVHLYQNAGGTFRNCRVLPPTITYTWSYDSANDGRFRPHATYPYQVLALDVEVVVANAGKTLDIGLAAGQDTVVAAVPLDTAGYTTITLGAGALNVIAAGGYLYATPSAAISAGDVKVHGTYVVSFGSSNAVYLQNTGPARFENCVLVSNAASDAVYAKTEAVNANAARFTLCHIEARPKNTDSMKAVNCESEWNDAPFYLCTLLGGSTNLTPAAGTAAGTCVSI